MKFYRFITRLFRIFSHLYFVEMRAVYPERIPEHGPVIIAANHPTSVLDAILLAMQTRRQIHFLVKSALFRNRFVSALLLRLGAIPVYRANEVDAAGARNIEVFEKVYELFERGGCLGLFPEGQNSPDGQVVDLRPGGARMALGAEARNQYRLGLVIVPVGLNFENRELFMSAVLLRFGQPIQVADYAGLHRQDPPEAVRRLTVELQEALRSQAIHVEDDQIHQLAKDLSEALGYRLAPLMSEERGQKAGESKLSSRWKRGLWKLLDWYRPEAGEVSDPFEIRIQDRKKLTAILSSAMAEDPSAVAALRRQVDRYLDHLHQTELSRTLKRSLDEPVRERLIRLRMTIYALVMAPVALFGLIHNIVPYLITRFSARLVRDEAIRTFAYFGVGFLMFALTYGGLGFWLWYGAGMSWNWVLVYLALLPPAGFATLRYRSYILIYRDKILVRTFFWDNAELVALLRRERRALIERFRELAGE
ncbi:MAG: 1-acyl-sn-glycerol-3-phosphate acyltransferase [Thermodesulfobacteriota bacterium]